MKRTAAAAVAGVALVGLIGAGVAAAVDGTGPVAGRLGDVLADLVDRGTITQDQADEVAEALTDAREDARAERPDQLDELLQETLGMDMEAVREQLKDGKTLLEIAGESAEDLADGMLDLLGQRLDQAVDEGRITQTQAAETLTRAKERTQAWLAGEDTGRGHGMDLMMGSMGRMGPGGIGHRGGPGRGSHGGSGQDLDTDEGSMLSDKARAASSQI